ncbi:hypothetical protein Y034_5972 [Burkholderia pseudomallei MSHR449]|nr:hypothetical protein Y034_5972 [Burkholderia pseudomallei MSHR449]
MPVRIQSLQVVSSRARSRNRIARCPLRAVPRPRLAGRVRRDAREARSEGRGARGARRAREEVCSGPEATSSGPRAGLDTGWRRGVARRGARASRRAARHEIRNTYRQARVFR